MRATYGAVAAVLGVTAAALASMLGDQRPETSWLVNARSGLPDGFNQTGWHAELLTNSTVIRTATELNLRLALWRAVQR